MTAATMTDRTLPEGILSDKPLTALAPMQDVTTLEFMHVIGKYGPPDYFFTEYFRVHETSTLEEPILRSITENNTGRPVFAQLIGEDLFHLRRAVQDLKQHGINAIDLNMGCPAPRVYKKNVGAGLLRDPNKIDQVLGTLRDAVDGLFTVKMRIGFENTAYFEEIIGLVNKHNVDLLSIHGRTAKEMYRGEVHYGCIQHGVQLAKPPVFANGNITSAQKALYVINDTGAFGAMIGRSAIRNPWIFLQIRQSMEGKEVFQPKLKDVYKYIEALFYAHLKPSVPELNHINYMKKFLNFIGLSVEPTGMFLHEIRRVRTAQELFAICQKYLLLDNAELDFAHEPYIGLIARPNCEENNDTCLN